MSYAPGDEYIDGVVSNCCGSPVYEGDRCSECGEGCGTEPSDEVTQDPSEKVPMCDGGSYYRVTKDCPNKALWGVEHTEANPQEDYDAQVCDECLVKLSRWVNITHKYPLYQPCRYCHKDFLEADMTTVRVGDHIEYVCTYCEDQNHE